jgi:DNA-binding transcriptional regulator YiaG
MTAPTALLRGQFVPIVKAPLEAPQTDGQFKPFACDYPKLLSAQTPLDDICRLWHSPSMAWTVEFTHQFEDWWNGLSENEQIDVDVKVRLLEELGPALARPHADTVQGSRHPNMKELRVQHAGHPYRVLFAFDPRRCAILLLGGDKTCNARWYDENTPLADKLFDDHLRTLEREKTQGREGANMARNFNELRNKMSPQARARSEAAAREAIQALPLSKIRDAQNITQVELAKRLNIDQSAVSKIEHRTDMYLSTLSDVIRAMGGQLELTARFPSGEVHILALTGSETKNEPALTNAKRWQRFTSTSLGHVMNLGPERIGQCQCHSGFSNTGRANKNKTVLNLTGLLMEGVRARSHQIDHSNWSNALSCRLR